MSTKKIYCNFIVILLVSSLLAGCGESNIDVVPTEIFQKDSGKTAMLEAAETDYEVPSTYPGIVVDTYGYEKSRDKVAFLTGENLPAIFSVVNADTEEVVYRGSVKRKDIEGEENLKVGIIDFSLVKEEGRYYIQTEIFGKSKNFVIGKGVYKKHFEESFSKLHSLRCIKCHSTRVPLENDLGTYINVSGGWHTDSEGQKDVVEGCQAVMDILTIFEYYPGVFTDDFGYDYSNNQIPDILDEVLYEVEWLLKMQNAETGGVYTSVSYHTIFGKDEKTYLIGGETTRATAYFCACMAKFSTFYKKYDNEMSTKAFQAAVLAWNCLSANKDIVGNDQMYRAAVEMYKASGLTVYNDVILEYLKDNVTNTLESRLNIDSAISYLGTARNTNVTYCTSLMAGIMARTEEKAELANNQRFSVESEEMTAEELLRNTYELLVVDYIISSNAYEPLEEDYLHYLGGRNLNSNDYINKLVTPDSYVQYMALTGKLYEYLGE